MGIVWLCYLCTGGLLLAVLLGFCLVERGYVQHYFVGSLLSDDSCVLFVFLVWSFRLGERLCRSGWIDQLFFLPGGINLGIGVISNDVILSLHWFGRGAGIGCNGSLLSLQYPQSRVCIG